MMTAHKLAVPGPAGAALRHRLVAFGLIFGIGLAVYAMPVAATVLAGEALYRERIMPPTDAVLVVTLWTAARADAPARRWPTLASAWRARHRMPGRLCSTSGLPLLRPAQWCEPTLTSAVRCG